MIEDFLKTGQFAYPAPTVAPTTVPASMIPSIPESVVWPVNAEYPQAIEEPYDRRMDTNPPASEKAPRVVSVAK